MINSLSHRVAVVLGGRMGTGFSIREGMEQGVAGWRVGGRVTARHCTALCCTAVACPSGSSPESVHTHIESEVKLTYLHAQRHTCICISPRATLLYIYVHSDISVCRRASIYIFSNKVPFATDTEDRRSERPNKLLQFASKFSQNSNWHNYRKQQKEALSSADFRDFQLSCLYL